MKKNEANFIALREVSSVCRDENEQTMKQKCEKNESSIAQQFFATKNWNDLTGEIKEQGMLKRCLGGYDLLMLGIGDIIGTGIFVLAGRTAADVAGPAIIFSFIIAGIASAFAGLCYSEVATLLPLAGSAYTFTYATCGELFAWIIGWDLLLEYVVGAAAVSVGWSSYFLSFLKDFGIDWKGPWTSSTFSWDSAHSKFSYEGNYVNIPAVVLSFTITFILALGVNMSARINHCIVFFKVFAVLLFIFIGLFYVETKNLHPLLPDEYPVYNVFRAATTLFFAYIGFDAVTCLSQETKKPQKNIPFGILGSLLVCSALYVLMSFVIVGLFDYKVYKFNKEAHEHPINFAINNKMQLKWLSIVIDVAALCGLGSVMLVSLMGQPRILHSMAKDGLMPNYFTKIHSRFKTPYISTIISGVTCAFAGGIFPIDFLADMTSVGTLFAFCAVAISVIILQKTQPDAHRPFQIMKLHLFGSDVHIIPMMTIMICLLLIINSFWLDWRLMLRWFGWMIIGIFIYLFYSRKNSIVNQNFKKSLNQNKKLITEAN